MRVSRLVELLVRLQLRGGASAADLAADLGVSVRTIYRDVDALSAAGVPVYTEIGRSGGIRIDPAYRIAGLPRLDDTEARSLLFGVVPTIAEQLGLDARAAERSLLPSMERATERNARVVRDRLLVEPSHWFVPLDETPVLRDVAQAVWSSREVVLRYRGEQVTAHPLGLILKGTTWYLLGLARRDGPREPRLFRISRLEEVEVRDAVFERPPEFDLADQWASLRDTFLGSLPEIAVTVRVAPRAEALLPALQEGRVRVPLPPDVERDDSGWAVLQLRFETPQRAVGLLLRLGADVEVLDPASVRDLMARTAREVAGLYDPGAG